MNSSSKLIITIILLILVLFNPLLWALETIPLDEAVREGKVQVKISGLGGSTGDAILIKVKRKIPETLQLSLTPGTVFKSTSGDVQNMIGSKIQGELIDETSYRPESEIYLNNDNELEYVIEAYCLDFYKSNPGTTDSFSLSQIDEHINNIIVAGEKAGYSNKIIQSAIWIDRDKVASSELKSRFPVNDEDIESAQELLKQFDEIMTSPNENGNDGSPSLYKGFTGHEEGGCFIINLNK